MFIIDTQSGLLFTNAIWVNPRAFIKQLYYQYIYVTLLNALSTKVKKKNSTQRKKTLIATKYSYIFLTDL